MYANRMLGHNNSDRVPADEDVELYKIEMGLSEDEFQKNFAWFVEEGYGIRG